MRNRLLALLLLCCVVGCGHVEHDVTPLRNVHAHNDYDHRRPLLDALDCGFCSIEADVALVDGEIRVTHDPKKTTPGRTLEKLYLDPLRKRVATHGGRVYRDGPSAILMIDCKSDPQFLYPALEKLLRRYTDMLTTWKDGDVHGGAITVVLTGGHPPAPVLLAERIRYAAIDGKAEDIGSTVPVEIMPQISMDWRSQFAWKGFGAMPAPERAKLHALVDRVHAHGRTIRLWAAPDQPRAWEELLEADVDYINTDNLPGQRQFLLDRAATKPSTSPPCTRRIQAGFPPDPGSR